MGGHRFGRLLGIAACLAVAAAIGLHLLQARDRANGAGLRLAAITDPGGTASVARVGADGSPRGTVTRGNGAPADPVGLPDGDVVYSDAVPDEQGARALYRCRPDGSGATRITFGRHDDGRPSVLDDGRIVFQRRFRDLAQDRPPVWMTIHPDGTQVALYHDGMAAEGGPEGAAGADPAPRMAEAHAPPPILTSLVDPARRTGTLLCLDAYASRHPAIAGLPRGAIRKVVIGRAGDPARGVLAEAPVQPDGSFLVEVPADTPLRLTLIGDGGAELASLESGIWVRGNENRGCIGCHEDADLAPDNRVPLALAKAGAHVP